MAIAVVVEVVFGTLAAVRRHSILDYVSSTVVLLGVSLPTFWLGLILIIIFGLWLRWLPISGRVDPRLGADLAAIPDTGIAPARQLGGGERLAATPHPAGADTGGLAGRDRGPYDPSLVDRIVRAGLRAHGSGQGTAGAADRGRSRGAERGAPGADRGWPRVRHAAGWRRRDGDDLSWPGLGQLTVTAIGARDYQIVQGVVVLLGAVFVLLNLLVDVLYAVLDPRIHYSEGPHPLPPAGTGEGPAAPLSAQALSLERIASLQSRPGRSFGGGLSATGRRWGDDPAGAGGHRGDRALSGA